jgi:ferredoxin-NADP reductase/truncated hemoglobin YjbI
MTNLSHSASFHSRERVAPLNHGIKHFFLPCCATDVNQVEAKRPNLSLCVQEAVVAETIQAAPDILRLRLEPLNELDWTPGQVIGLMNPSGAARSYSIVSCKDDYYIEINLRLHRHGVVSGWAKGLSVGDSVRFQGPTGNVVWREDLAERPLALIGTGTGGGVLAGIARDAVLRGHHGPIRLFHGARSAADLYLPALLADLPQGRIDLVQAASRESVGNAPAARITDLAFAAKTDLAGAAVFLCGNPDMVETARIGAVRAGAELDLIHADPFDPPQPYMTTETSKILAIEPDPELWAALEQGVRLTEILTEFYGEVYEDPRLAPFFHRVTKQRAIEKQYNFLQDLFHGTKLYFGEKPFNAHHWMVISDELFDYREKLFFAVVRRYDLAEPLIRRWAAIHETFRREIVKSAPRGILRDGREVSIEGYAREVLDVGAVCDGCFGEVHSGETVLMHTRTGEIFCEKCEGKHKVQAA